MSRRTASRRTVLVTIAATVLAVLLAVLLTPRPPAVSAARTGDEAVAEQLVALLPDTRGQRGVAVAVVDDAGVRTAGLGRTGGPEDQPVTPATAFEIGSVTKPLTGMLLAERVAAGEVALDDAVGDVVEGSRRLASTGSATLEELATHRSGLPRVPMEPAFLARSVLASLTGGNPYPYDAEDVLEFAGAAEAPGGAEPAYSNLGAATLGQALALQAGEDYGALLESTVTDPLGMSDTVVAEDPSDVPADRAYGVGGNGLPKSPWVSEGFAPAGGVWSTADDLAVLLQALLDGSAPGGEVATEPRADFTGDDRIGLFWIVSEVDGRTVTWHNGGTGGFRAWVGVDREARRGVAVLSSGTEGLDDVARELLLLEEDS